MSEGRSNAAIGQSLWISEGTVEKHVRSIMSKLNLPETGGDHRGVLAVIAFLVRAQLSTRAQMACAVKADLCTKP